MKQKLIYGIGINDAKYSISIKKELEKVNGKRRREVVWQCPYYFKWTDMLRRCYSEKFKHKHTTYKDCTVCQEWLTFSTFRKWMETQDWINKDLDKDILILGNKEYAPDKCVFIEQKVNKFLTDRVNNRGEYLIGCYWNKERGKFQAGCNNIFSGKLEYLGRFDTEIEAHLAWKKRKHELAFQLADSEYVTDERVRRRLRTRYENYTILEVSIS